MPHVALIGDSIFDNASYVEPGSSVSDHLRQILSSDWQVTLLAADGATSTVTQDQLHRITDDVTHLVLSAGGNDALWMSGNLFSLSTDDIRESLHKLGEQCREFQKNYRKLIGSLREFRLPLAVCTVYDSVPGLELPELTGLCTFNDVITRVAFENALPLIDLRVICNETQDYSEVSPIEPSSAGGHKIARAISSAIQGNDQLVIG